MKLVGMSALTAGDDDYLIKYIHNKSDYSSGELSIEGGGNDHLTKNIRGKYGSE